MFDGIKLGDCSLGLSGAAYVHWQADVILAMPPHSVHDVAGFAESMGRQKPNWYGKDRADSQRVFKD